MARRAVGALFFAVWLSNSKLTYKLAVSTHKEHDEIQKNPIMGPEAKSMRAGDEKL